MYEFQLRLEKFQRGKSIGIDDQEKIVAAVNDLMAGQNILILRDKGNALWICLHYKLISKQPKIVIFIPEAFSWANFYKYKKEINEKINGWLPFDVEKPAGLFQLHEYKKSHAAADQCLLTLVYAFGCCLNYPKSYLEPFGESKERIRRAISKALMDKKMPTIEDMWGAQPANGN